MDEEAENSLILVHQMTPLLEVENLHVAYRSRTGRSLPALAGVSFQVQAGETLGVLGESGSGKSTLAAALLGLLPANATIKKGAIRFEGQDLIQKQVRELEKIRGNRIGLVFQEPSLALHPTIRVGEQIRDVIAVHEALNKKAAQEKALRILTTLFSSEAQRIANSYAHELSGGQRQRALIAEAIACGPSLLIADEPTASLDPSTQQEILSLLRELQQKLTLAMILISHNPAVLAGSADRVLILYAGSVAETGPANEVLGLPLHPYTRALLQCVPPELRQSSVPRKSKLEVIAGDPPNLTQLGYGCRFEPRCKDRMAICIAKEPAEVILGKSHVVSCFKYGD